MLENPGITSISISGGGPKGAGHVGALAALNAFGIMRGVRHVYGTSVGALIGVLLAVGMTAEQLEELVKEQDFKKLLDDEPTFLGNSGAPIIKMLNTHIVRQLLLALGEYSQDLSVRHIKNRDLIRNILGRHNIAIPVVGSPFVAFVAAEGDLAQKALNFTFKDLLTLSRDDPVRFKLFSTNAVRASHPSGPLQPCIFNHAATPAVKLVDACRASASLPKVLKPHEIGGVLYQDGGTLENTLWIPAVNADKQLMLVFRDPNSVDLLNAWECWYANRTPENKKKYEETHLKYGRVNRAVRNYAAYHAFPDKAQEDPRSMVEIRENGLRALLDKRPNSVLIVDTPGITSTDFNKAKNKAEFLFLYNYFSTATALVKKRLGAVPRAEGDVDDEAYKKRIELGMFLLKHFKAAGGESAKVFNQKQNDMLAICRTLMNTRVASAVAFRAYVNKCAERRNTWDPSETRSISLMREMGREKSLPQFLKDLVVDVTRSNRPQLAFVKQAARDNLLGLQR